MCLQRADKRHLTVCVNAAYLKVVIKTLETKQNILVIGNEVEVNFYALFLLSTRVLSLCL